MSIIMVATGYGSKDIVRIDRESLVKGDENKYIRR